VFVARLASSLAAMCSVQVVTPAPNFLTSYNELSGEVRVSCFLYAPRYFRTLAHSAGGIPAQLSKSKLTGLLIPPFLICFVASSIWKAFSADVIHANWAISSVPGYFAKLLSGVPLLTTLRGEDVNIKRGGRKAVLSFALWASDRVVVVGDDMRAELVNYYPQYAEKIAVVKNGADTPFSVPEKNVDFTTLELVFVGSLIERKNISNTLHALTHLKSGGVKFIFRVVGGGDKRPLKELVETLDLHGCVELMGEQPPAVVEGIMVQSHVYVSSSTHEGRPNSVVEAMAAGCCCVLSDITGHRELSEDGRALLFSLDEPVHLARVINRLYTDDSEIGAISRRSHSWALDECATWHDSAREYLAEFSGLIHRSK